MPLTFAALFKQHAKDVIQYQFFNEQFAICSFSRQANPKFESFLQIWEKFFSDPLLIVRWPLLGIPEESEE
ncbi:MAG: hypothetical protein EXR81_01315 [Gammaproteobacteria bacterium]|nr:hypothetical protein [Gammaproteobacteria bacterium]